MKSKRYICILCLSLLLAAGANAAQASQWTFDKVHSSIYFDIQHIYSTVRGQFNDFSGTFVFDPDNLEGSRIDMTVQTQSVDTYITKRDNHLRSDDFFAVDRYPTMTFKSRSIEHLGQDKYRILGDFTIKDVTRTLAIPFTFHGIRENPLQKGKEVAGFDAHFVIDRLDYHVGSGKFAQMGAVGRNVDIFITLEMLRDK